MGTVHAKVPNQKSDMNAKGPTPEKFDIKSVPVKVQRVHIDGLKRTKDDFVSREVKDVFQATNFQEMVVQANAARIRLEKLGIFKHVEVVIDTSSGPGASKTGYDVTFAVEEKKWIGGGINTILGDNNPTLMFVLNFPNTLGRGEGVNLDYRYGNRENRGYHCSFTKPFELNHDAKFTANIFETNGDYPWSGYKQTDKGVSLEFSYPSSLGVHGISWEGIWRELNADSKTTSFAVREQCGHSIKSSLKHTFILDNRDSYVLPNSGCRLKTVQEYAGLGGDSEFFKSDVEFQASQPLPLDSSIQLSLAGGIMKSLNPDKNISICDKFFIGGPLHLRGFTMKGAGPHSDGNAVGAESYWLGGLHLYTPLPFRPGKGGFGELFRTHFFINAGNTANIDFQRDFKSNLSSLSNQIRLSYGGGIVLRLGQIARLEFNYVIPFKYQKEDSIQSGIQYGVGVTFS